MKIMTLRATTRGTYLIFHKLYIKLFPAFETLCLSRLFFKFLLWKPLLPATEKLPVEVELHFRINISLLLPPKFDLKGGLDYPPLWIAGIEGNLLKSPEQVCPSPVYPVRHVHACDPMVLIQLAFTWHERFLAHSSISEKWQAFNHDSWSMIHV